MSQLTLGLIFFAVFLLIWAATGHGLWVLLSFVFGQSNKKPCPECKARLDKNDKACRSCGWTTRTIHRTAAMHVCNQAISAALSRGLIDKEAFDRGTKTIADLERSLSESDRQVPSSTVPPLSPVVKDRQAQAPLPKVEQDVPPILMPVIAKPLPHALDQEYSEPPSAPLPQITRIKQTWGKWLSAFMEEKNIQWGELAGGLMILCCSTALVISFWEHIATRPWLKFSIFTGVNAATLALGLNAWHRWKLPTTSRGILMIGMLLLPLNFLAFAIFTLGLPWDSWTVVGEVVSLGVLGCLAWFAAKVLTPQAEWVTTLTMVGFAVANLVVRRVVDAATNPEVLWLSAGVLMGFYVATMLIGKHFLTIGSKSTVDDVNQTYSHSLVRLLCLGTFGVIIAFGLLLGCSGDSLRTAHRLSPLLPIGAIPFLFYSFAIREQSSVESRWLMASFLLAACSLATSCFGVVFAWPTPLLIVLCWMGLGMLLAVFGRRNPSPLFGYAYYLIGGCVVPIVWHVWSGHVELNNDTWQVLVRAMVTADTGFSIVAWSLVCLIVSILQTHYESNRHALVALRAAGLNGIVGTAILTVFGFGRHEYAVSVALIYLLYAVAMIGVAAVRRRRYLDAIAGAFVVASCFQGIAFGWLQETGWMGALFWSLAVAAILLIAAVCIRKGFLAEPFVAPKPLHLWSRGTGALAVIVAMFWFIFGETAILNPDSYHIGTKELASLAAIWVAIAWMQKLATDWTLAQLLATATGMLFIYHFAKEQSWYGVAPVGVLHPYSIQMHLAWFSTFTMFSSLLVLLATRWQGAGEDEASLSKKIAKTFLALHKYSVSPWLLHAAVICYIGLAYYGATPGCIQELMPLDGIAETKQATFTIAGQSTTRNIPDISRLELASIPHGAAGWNAVSAGEGFGGLPRMIWLWSFLCMSLVVCHWGRSERWISVLLISCLCSIALPIASHWEPDVAVASAMRWATSFVYALGCVLLCGWYVFRGPDEQGEHGDRDDLTTRFDTYFSTLLANYLLSIGLMATIVVLAAVSHFEFGSWEVMFWIVSCTLALVGVVVFLSTGASGRGSSGSHNGIASSVLLIAPFLAWFGLQIALGIVQHPLTGPNGNSVFVRMGLAMSYTIPILIFSAGLIAISVVRRSAGIAFLSCLVLLLSGLAGFMLTLKSEGLKPTAWVGLFAMLTIISGSFALIWNWYVNTNSFGWFKLTQVSPQLESDRASWQKCLRQIAIGFLSVSVCLTAFLLFLNGRFLNRIEIFSLAGVLAVGVAFAAHWYATKRAALHWWLTGFSFLIAGFVASIPSSLTTSIVVPSVVLLISGAIMAWRVASKSASIGELTAISLPLIQSFLMALRILLVGGTQTISVALICVATAISLFVAWRSQRFSFVVGALVAAHVAGLVHTLSSWGGTNFYDSAVSTILAQISLASVMSFLCSVVGFPAAMRAWNGVAVFLLAAMSFLWYLLSLNQTTDPFPLGYFSIAVCACTLGSVARYWLRTTRHTDLLVYLSGLCSVVLFFQMLHPEPKNLLWISTLVFAAYCLASSFVWRGSDRIRGAINRLGMLPTLEARLSSSVVIFANTALALGVTVLGFAAQFLCESQPLRLASSQAIMAVAFAVGLLARYHELSAMDMNSNHANEGSRLMRIFALILGVCAAIAFGWHFDSIDRVSGLSRVSYASLSMALMGLAYGFGLIKWVGLSESWRQAALPLMPFLVSTTAVAVAVILVSEWSLGHEGTMEKMSAPAIVCVLIALAASIVACIVAALIPGKDAFGLSERGRTVYVYVSEVLLVMLIMHLRLTMPWLFGGWVQAVWPLGIVGLAFVGLGVSEWAKRNSLGVLAEPLERTGMLLPVLPLLTHWIVPSQVHYGVSLLCASIAYAAFGYLRKSMLYWGASVVAGNAALWFALQSTHFAFVQHPQLWVIPPSLSFLAIVQIFKDKLPREQVATGRYLATASIYIASTAEVFIQGISEAPWLPIVLAGLSIGGVFAGIALRIRAMLWLGSMFLCVAMFTVIWHAAVDLQQTWVWYVSGIVMGVLILTMFALFEKRKVQLKGLVSRLQTWED